MSPGYTATPMNLRPEVPEQVTKFRSRYAARPDSHSGRTGRAGHVPAERGSKSLRGRRPYGRRRLHLLV